VPPSTELIPNKYVWMLEPRSKLDLELDNKTHKGNFSTQKPQRQWINISGEGGGDDNADGG